MSAQVIVKDQITPAGIRKVEATPDSTVCSTKINIEINTKANTLQRVVFTNGCDGNSKGLGALLKGMTPEEATKRLKGIPCGKKNTSCPDQLAKVLLNLKNSKPIAVAK